MEITRDTMRSDGKTVGQAMDEDAAFLRGLGFDCPGGQPTIDERVDAFKMKMRDAVLAAMDTVSPTGKGWKDGDLTPLFKAVDAHAENLFWRLYMEEFIPLNKIQAHVEKL